MIDKQLSSEQLDEAAPSRRPDEEEQERMVVEELEWVAAHYAAELRELRNP